jgi:hypothetical protein
VNYEQAENKVCRVIGNAFGVPAGYFWQAAYWLPSRPRAGAAPWVAAGAQAAWLEAAAIRTLTQGEG